MTQKRRLKDMFISNRHNKSEPNSDVPKETNNNENNSRNDVEPNSDDDGNVNLFRELSSFVKRGLRPVQNIQWNRNSLPMDVNQSQKCSPGSC